MTRRATPIIFLSAAFLSAAAPAFAAPVTAVDLASIDRGATIVGPVGPQVEASLAIDDMTSIGDIVSQVDCPAGFMSCVPPDNPAGTIYTYIHTITPGVDGPNDPPFPNPPNVIDPGVIDSFSLGFAPAGFNGVAGYDFAAAEANGLSFTIDQDTDGLLSWSLASGDWASGVAITFFFQTTQPPAGPGGVFVLNSAQGAGSGPGPIPTAVQTPVPLPAAAWILIAGLGALGFGVRKRKG